MRFCDRNILIKFSTNEILQRFLTSIPGEFPKYFTKHCNLGNSQNCLFIKTNHKIFNSNNHTVGSMDLK